MEPLTISLPEDAKRFVDDQVAQGGISTADKYIAALIDDARRRNVYQEIRELLLAGARSPGVELTPEEWQAMRREADAAHAPQMFLTAQNIESHNVAPGNPAQRRA